MGHASRRLARTFGAVIASRAPGERRPRALATCMTPERSGHNSKGAISCGIEYKGRLDSRWV